MKKSSKIAQWIFTGLFGICALGNGFHISSLLLLIAAILMMPVPMIRNYLKKIKIKNWLAITLAVVVFFSGIMTSPSYQDADTTSDIDSSYSETIDNDSNKTTSSEKNTSSSPTSSSLNSSNTTSNTPSSTDKSTSSNSNTSNKNPSIVGNGSVSAVKLSNIPAYSGSAFVYVNNNQPNFSANELTTVAYESYSSLDSLNRCGVAIASCGTEIMPKENEKRGSISNVYPSGWEQAKYDGISGGYLWNRCHLIGWQLSAENANRKNLITGTRYMNINGMLTFENMVADYIKETDNHVAYRVTPIFDGNNLVCSGVQMEAYSIEDNGDGICFNVYCYNVQPGININYATGESSSTSNSNNSSTTQPSSSSQQPTIEEDNNTDSSSAKYILNTNTKKFHYPSCGSAGRIAAKNYGESNESREQLIAQGYSPCGNCDP